jgi:hypothetical protein
LVSDKGYYDSDKQKEVEELRESVIESVMKRRMDASYREMIDKKVDEKKRQEKAHRNENMEKFIDVLLKKMILEYKEFHTLTERHHVRYKYEKGEPLVLFPMIIEEWTLYDDYAPLRYEDPPQDEFIVCHGGNKYGLHCSISNEKIKYLHRAKKPVYFTFTTQKSRLQS